MKGMFDSVIKNVRLLNETTLSNIGINNGLFSIISEEEIVGYSEWDAKGQIILPPFVEMHTHLDTVLTAGSPYNKSGGLYEAINIWKDKKKPINI